MPIIIIAVLVFLAYKWREGKAKATPKTQTKKLGGSSLPGNNFDAGDSMTLGPGQSCDCAPDPSSVTYAQSGGEDGIMSPASAPAAVSPTGVVVGRGWVAPDGVTPAQSLTPVNVSNIANAVNKVNFVRSK